MKAQDYVTYTISLLERADGLSREDKYIIANKLRRSQMDLDSCTAVLGILQSIVTEVQYYAEDFNKADVANTIANLRDVQSHWQSQMDAIRKLPLEEIENTQGEILFYVLSVVTDITAYCYGYDSAEQMTVDLNIGAEEQVLALPDEIILNMRQAIFTGKARVKCIAENKAINIIDATVYAYPMKKRTLYVVPAYDTLD
jgi:hypothetical protein